MFVESKVFDLICDSWYEFQKDLRNTDSFQCKGHVNVFTEVNDSVTDICIDLKLKNCMQSDGNNFGNYFTDRFFIMNKRKIFIVEILKDKSMIVQLFL